MLFGMSQSLSRLLHQFMPITGKGQPAIGRNQLSEMPVIGQVRHHDGATVAEWSGIRMLSPSPIIRVAQPFKP
jgi:hypothetical protein